MTIVQDPSKQATMPFIKATESTRMQLRTEAECEPFFVDLTKLPPSQLDHLRDCGLLTKTDVDSTDVCLLKDQHLKYLQKLWKDHTQQSVQLPPSFVSLDASRSWMIYWSLHACDLLGHVPEQEDCEAIIHTLSTFYSRAKVTLPKESVQKDKILQAAISTENKDGTVSFQAGGFGGGPGQMAHAANTYAAVLALSIIAGYHISRKKASDAALALLEKVRLEFYPWMLSLQDSQTGSFRMQHDGEVDVRATYCLCAAAGLLNLLELVQAGPAADFVASCQTWEGGFGAEPFAEAHGGYTFCAIAALQLLKRADSIDMDAAAGYLARRQLALEGGFSGRSNKLVDGCYSFWQGGAAAIVSALLLRDESGPNRFSNDPWAVKDNNSFPSSLLFDQAMLERYILLCAQDVHGGLRDKPSKNRDFYHSCYNLSGLSVAQHCDKSELYGHQSLSKVGQTHPCYNIQIDHANYVLKYFSTR